MKLIGIDIGGTKVSLSVGDKSGRISSQIRIDTHSVSDPERGVSKILELISSLLERESLSIKEISAIGLAAPGPLSRKMGTLLAPPNLPLWINVPLVDRLENEFGTEVFWDNDGNAGVLAESIFGKRREMQNLIFLTMSTGIGGGLIIGGKLIRGESDSAGEVGHMILDPKGPQCACGQQGCFEAYCGGISIQKRVGMSMEMLVQKVKEGDQSLLRIWEEYLERLAQGIGILIQTLNPEALILGTIISKNAALFIPPLKEAIKRYVWEAPLRDCQLEGSQLGERRGDLAALAVALYGLTRQP